MGIPQGFIQELLSRADCVEVVGRHVQLKKAGANFMGLCPFHGEKSPSFTVSPTKQFFHCFGCGKNGNAVGFLMDHLGMSFIEAVQDLAGSMGLQVPQDDASPQDRARAQALRAQQTSLADMMLKASQAYQMQLKTSERGIAYFKKRGVSGEVAKTYALGYAPPGWNALAGVFAEYGDPKLVECGLVIESDGETAAEKRRRDRFRDRVMFPIRNVKGETIGFGGRILDQGEPKYLNSPETPLFSKGRELYGLWEGKDAIRKAGYALVTEGYMDVVALAQHGFGHAVATLGTACTPEHVHKLFRFTDHVVFGFDGDAAGRRAARKALDGALPYATDTRSVKFLFLPAEHDPDSFIRELGAEAFGHAVQKATPLSQFLVDSCRAGSDTDTAEGRAQTLANAQPLWKLLPEGTLRIQLLNEFAALAGMTTASLKDAWGLNAPAQSQQFGRYQEHSGKFNKHADKWAKSPKSTPPGAFGQAISGVVRGSAPSRPDLLARMALEAHEMLANLGGSQLGMLAALPGSHGALFVWLEEQLHAHGAQPWAALREGLRANPELVDALALAQKLMAADDLAPAAEAQEEGEKADSTAKTVALGRVHAFTDLLRRLTIDTLKTQETEAINAAGKDPDALNRYRRLVEERRALEATQ